MIARLFAYYRDRPIMPPSVAVPVVYLHIALIAAFCLFNRA